MGTVQDNCYYPEDCDSTGVDCLRCVQKTAEATRALTASPTAAWASAVFHRMYSYAACRQMEHSFVHACGAASVGPQLVQISAAA
jgi:hypothetical protein